MIKTKPLKKTVIAFTIAGMVAINPIFVQADLGDQLLKYGMEHEDVKVLQQHLKDLGYFNYDDITTYYGDITVEAVKEFQNAEGLDVDGAFGQSTFKALQAALDKTKYTGVEPLVYTRLLKEEVTGKDVQAFQEVLRLLGYLEIENCTEYFGSMTKEALMNLQKDYGIKVDGIAGAETINTINNILKGNLRKPAPAAPNRGSSVANSFGEKIVSVAKKYLGTPYKYATAGPKSFDCSGFTQYVFKQLGINISRSSSTQARDGKKVSKKDLQIGDLLIFSGTKGSNPGHTGIYVGNNKFIHASSGGSRSVIISDLNSNHYTKRFLYGRRVY